MTALLLAGGEFISDVGMLASGATGRVLGHATVSASRCGQWLRNLTYDDTVGFERVNGDLISSAWRAGLGPVRASDAESADPGDGARLVFDIDSTVIQTYGSLKEGASKRNYRGIRGYHPMILAEASTGQVLASRLRDGNAAPAKDAPGFLDDAFTRIAQSVVAADETVGPVRYV